MKKTLSYIFILILFIISGAFSWRLYFQQYSQEDTVNIHLFPKTIGEWTSKELTISESDYEILETRNAFTRKYTNANGESVYLFIVYSQNNRKVSHPPELCYTGSGAIILKNKPETINLSAEKSLEVNSVFVELGKTQQQLYYWFKVGDSFIANYWKQQFVIAVKTFSGKPSSSALIRLSSTLKGEGQADAASKVIQNFIPSIIPHIQQYLP